MAWPSPPTPDGRLSSQGVTRRAPLFYVSPGQINYLVPAGTAIGPAHLLVSSGTRGTASGALQIDRVAPGLYTANAHGTGVAAALFLRVASNGSRTEGLIFDPVTGSAAPVDLGPEGDQVYLLLFGTGICGFTSQGTATVGGVPVPVRAAAPQGQYAGLDQVSIGPLPRSLAGRGNVDVALWADERRANTAIVSIR